MHNLVIRGHDLTQARTPEELAMMTQAAGFHNLQFAMNMSLKEVDTSGTALNPGMGTYFKNLFGAKDIQIALLSCYSNLIHPDVSKREFILQKFESYLRHAKYFGASMVASETGSVIPELGYSEENFTDETFADLVMVIKRLVKAGETYNTLVAIEGGLNHPLYGVKRTKQLVDAIASPFLGIILDPTNLITAQTHEEIVAIVKEAFELYGDQIVALHLKDYVIEDGVVKPVNLGEGIIPYQEILEIVESHKPYCYIVLEETQDTGLTQAKELLEKSNP